MPRKINVPIQSPCTDSVEAVCRACEQQPTPLMDHEFVNGGTEVVLYFADAEAVAPAKSKAKAAPRKKTSRRP
jgi:hypothetical protein